MKIIFQVSCKTKGKICLYGPTKYEFYKLNFDLIFIVF
jgi:hypothetical protein